jgi:hypothetical protein
VRLTTSPSLRAECHGIWEPKPPGTLWATLGLLRDSFNFIFTTKITIIVRMITRLYVVLLCYCDTMVDCDIQHEVSEHGSNVVCYEKSVKSGHNRQF